MYRMDMKYIGGRLLNKTYLRRDVLDTNRHYGPEDYRDEENIRVA
jgi:hypothetical protein